ncbi:MAG: beta strand repeat-containing protein, partial [bacterium JZ-2024 1]
SSTAFFIDPATGNAEGNDINGGGIAGTTQQSVGVWCDGAGSAVSIINNTINGGNGNISIAKLITNGCALTESGNSYNSGGPDSYGMWVENCPAGTIIENRVLYGGNGTVTSTGLKLKNCNAEVRNNIIDGGSAPTATGIDVDQSNPWIHNNTITGSQAGTTTTSARGVAYSGGSGGTLGGSAGQGNDITGATGSAHPTDSYAVYVDNSSPTISSNTPSLNGGQGTNTYGLYITNGSDPVVQFNTINGGTATAQSVGIFSDSAAWDDDPGADDTTGNTISGGTCTGSGCASLGISLTAGTPTIGPNNNIDGGSGGFTFAIAVDGTANPTITGNSSINGGTATTQSIGIRGSTSSWTGTVSSNTISGGTCSGFLCNSYGIYLGAGTPTIGPNNNIDGGTGALTFGISVVGSANPTITGNTSIKGGTATWGSSIGIRGSASSWSGIVSDNTIISGGTCSGCLSLGIFLIAGTPTIGPNNNIDGGTGALTFGIAMDLTANPTITGNTSINGGTATTQSIGIRGDTSSWTGIVSNNTISGGTCTGCDSLGIYLIAGTPIIGPSNDIDGGTGDYTRGIAVDINANPTITGNTSINGGNATSQGVGIYGNTSSWNKTVSGNTISGGTSCTTFLCNSSGIYLTAGTPTIGPNTSISGGTGVLTRGIAVFGSANPTITGNTSISGGTATSYSFGIDGNTSFWNKTVSGNTISGGSCTGWGCVSLGISLGAGTPTIGSNNSISGGTGANSYGIAVLGTANPTITNNSSIKGGITTSDSTGIYGNTSSWMATVSGNTISGGSCTASGCNSYGIFLGAGTPTIGSNNSISGGTGSATFGIYLDGTANPTITGNTSISGGNATSQGVGIYGNTSSWTGTVSGNTISGGTCTAPGCNSYGIRLLGSTPTITGNTITAGTATNAWGVWIHSPLLNLTNNAISGGTGSGFDVDDLRPLGFGCITATGTTTTNFNGSIDDSVVEIGDGDGLDGDVQGPFTIVPELRITNFGNCISGIDTSL